MDSEGVKKYFHLKKDLLECPVCFQTIDSVPIHQCRNGHVVCKNCRPKLRTCPICRDGPISQRNLKLEEIVESVTQNEIKTVGRCCKCCCGICNKCCCGCFGIQIGAKVILILSLIFDVLLLKNNVSTDVNLSDWLTMQFFNDPSRFVSGHEINPILVASIIIHLILIALDVLAIIGIFLKKPGFMVGWLIVKMIPMVWFKIASFVMTIMTLYVVTCTAVSPYDTGVLIVVSDAVYLLASLLP